MSLLPGYIASVFHSLLWAAGCVGIGYILLKRMKGLSRLEILVASFLAGCVAWILMSLALAAFGIFVPVVMICLVYVAGIVSIVVFGLIWIREYRGAIGFNIWHAVLALILLVQLLYTLVPVTAFDALCYHLPLAQYMLAKGTIEWTPSIFNSAFPQGYEILQGIALAVGGDAGASMLSWLFSAASSLCLLCIGNRLRMPQIGTWSAIAVSLTPLWFELGSAPMNEIGIAFGILFLVLAILMHAPGWLFGIGLGWLLSIKYYGLEFGALALIVWIFQDRPSLRSVIIAIATAAVISGFWYIRDIVIFANPVFPYFHDFFVRLGLPRASEMKGYAWDAYSQFEQFGSPRSIGGLLSAPFRLLMNPSPDFIENAGSSWKYTGWLAILWPLAIIPAWKTKKELIGPYVLVILSVFMWTVVHGIIYLRFLTPLLPLMYLLSFFIPVSWVSIGWIGRMPRAIVSLVVVFVCLWHLVGPTTAVSFYEIPFNPSERDIFLDRRIFGWSIIREINEMEPPPVVYYLYGEHARYYCRFPVYMGWRETNGYTEFHEHASSGEDLGRWLEGIGVEILLVNHGRGAEVADRVRAVLLDETFRSFYEPGAIEYRFTSVYINRNSDIEISEIIPNGQ